MSRKITLALLLVTSFVNSAIGQVDYDFDDNPSYYYWQNSDDCHTLGTSFKAEKPQHELSFANVTFDDIRQDAIYLTTTDNAYTSIIVSDCNFKQFSFNQRIGILIEGFDEPTKRHLVNVTGNKFVDNQPTGYAPTAGIELRESAGNVLQNIVEGTGYENGVITSGTNTLRSTTLICDNLLKNAGLAGGVGAGISTSFWRGYAKMNRVLDNIVGHISGQGDDGGIVFSRYSTNADEGLRLSHSSSSIDMSGVHVAGVSNYAANDTIDLNGTTSNGSQITIAGSLLSLGTSSTAPTTYDDYGQNSFLAPVGNDFIFNSSGSVELIDIANGIGVNQNFWAHGTWTAFTPVTAANLDSWLTNTTCSTGTVVVSSTPLHHDGGDIYCSSGEISPPGTEPAGGSEDPSEKANDEINCSAIFYYGSNMGRNGYDRIAFDTTKFFIENCYKEKIAFRGFNTLAGALQGLPEPRAKKNPEYREWLKKVLYLSTDTLYYCGAISSLFITFQVDDPEFPDYNTVIAIFDYLLEKNRCPENNENYLKDRAYFRKRQHQFWADSVRDSMATPLDTGAVTLEEAGFGWIRAKSDVAKSPAHLRQYLGEVSVRNNPFRKENELTIEMLRDGYARIEIFDILGRNHFDDGNYLRYPEGKRSIRLPDELPTGTLYLRVTTPLGEIRTLQLQKVN